MAFRDWTIRSKLWFIVICNTIVLILISATSFKMMRTLSNHLVNVGQKQMSVVRNMTLIDMMHDGIRAVVYRAQIAFNQKILKNCRRHALN